MLAGRDYWAGCGRNPAAKGSALLGVRAMLARSFERIHRSNLAALGVLAIKIPRQAAPVGRQGPQRYTRPWLRSAICEGRLSRPSPGPARVAPLEPGLRQALAQSTFAAAGEKKPPELG